MSTTIRTPGDVHATLLDIAKKTTDQVQANQSPVDTVLPDAIQGLPQPPTGR
jgi:hypothetical protein